MANLFEYFHNFVSHFLQIKVFIVKNADFIYIIFLHLFELIRLFSPSFQRFLLSWYYWLFFFFEFLVLAQLFVIRFDNSLDLIFFVMQILDLSNVIFLRVVEYFK